MEQITNIKRNPDDEVAIDTQPYMFPIMTAPTVTMRAIYPGEPIPYYPDPQSDQKKIVPPRVQKACANCKKSHHACDNERPCRRCIDRGTQCFDVESRKRGRKKLGDTVSPPMEPKNTSSPTNQEILSGVENNSSSPEMESLTLMDLPNVGPENVDIFHDLLFSSLLDEDNKVAKKVHTEHGSPGPLMLDFYISAKDMNQVFIQARQKVVESAPEFVPCVLMMEEWLEAVCVRDRIKHHLTRQNIEQQKRIFCETLAVWVDIFGNLGTPMITWERGEVVHFYNDAWKSLTGYSAPTPTKLFSFEIMKQMTPTSRVLYLQCMKNFYLMSHIDSWSVPCEFYDLRDPQRKKTTSGMLSMTIKRDYLTLPLMFLGIFLPNASDPATYLMTSMR